MVTITVQAKGKIDAVDELRKQILGKKVNIFYAEVPQFLFPRRVLEVSGVEGGLRHGMFKVMVENISAPFHVSAGSKIEVYEN